MGLQIIKPNTKIDFIGLRKMTFILSAVLIIAGIASLSVKGGPKYGIDFAGGIIVQLKFQEAIEIETLKDALAESNLDDVVVQRFGMQADNEYLVRMSSEGMNTKTVRNEVEKTLAANMADSGFEVQRQEMVGPKVGSDLREKALKSLFYAVLLIAIYISGRFESRWVASGFMASGLIGAIYGLGLLEISTMWLVPSALLITIFLCWFLKLNYALGAVSALIHDVTITVGIFSIMGKEFDLTIVAALLTIIGYSLNDTIIVYDRIRENLKSKLHPTLKDVINTGINRTLSRTLLTSGTTLMVVLCLYLFGGGVIHDFALALLIGIGVGTYSSIFVASPILMGFKPKMEDEDEPEPEAA
jgi:preprotein translocase subunit SecF